MTPKLEIWRGYRERGNFTRKECDYLDQLYRRLDFMGGRIVNAQDGKNLEGLKHEMAALTWALARIFKETEGYLQE